MADYLDAKSVALFSSPADESEPGNELTGYGYSRQPVRWRFRCVRSGRHLYEREVTFEIPEGATVHAYGFYDVAGRYIGGEMIPRSTLPGLEPPFHFHRGGSLCLPLAIEVSYSWLPLRQLFRRSVTESS